MLVVRSLTAVGKLLIPLVISFNVAAQDTTDPRFFDYYADGFINRIAEFSFGWFNKLDPDQLEAYNSAVTHAVMFADNGETVSWYKNDASGKAVPVMTWQSNGGYCRRVYIQAIAYNVERHINATACFDGVSERWKWYNDKY